jgi:hypothetical protein
LTRSSLILISTLALAAAAALTEGRAASPPDNVTGAVQEAEQACTALGGKPDGAAVLRSEDVNGDGGEDWIADYAKFKCEGAESPLCRNGGCTLQLYFWAGDASWELVFEDLIKSYKFGKSSGKPMMYATTPGTPCNKPEAETCSYSYWLDKDAVIPVK